MKKLLLFVLILSCTETFSQATVDSFLFLKKNQLKDSVVDGKAVKVLIEPLAISLAPVVNSTKATVESLTVDLKAANDRIARLEALAPGLPTPGEINTSTYTLTASDNGKTILAKVGCTITIPVMKAGFKCWVVRKSGSVKFSGNYTKRTGFTPLASINQKVEIHYDTDTQATIY